MDSVVEKRRVYHRAYYRKHRDKLRAWYRASWAKKTDVQKARKRDVSKAWDKANPEKRKAYAKKFRRPYTPEMNIRKYGLSLERFNWMFEKQGRCCASCNSNDPQSHSGWQIDHNHRTKLVRAILCGPCNRTIGHAKESARRLRACAEYLEIANECYDPT